MGTECIQGVPAIATKVQEILVQYPRYLETAIRDAQASGELRSGDPAADAKMLFAYVEGSLAQARIHNDTAILRGLATSGFALIGLAAPSSPTKPRKASKAAA